MDSALPTFDRVLVVCAHPDDESFGLGAVLSTLADAGSRLTVVCFTRGAASTLQAVAGDLATIRAAELDAAGEVLGVTRVELLDYPDGALATVPIDELTAHVVGVARDVEPSILLVFDHGGITGHPDHQHATTAALHAAATLSLRVLAWAIPAKVADALNAEFGTTFVGRSDDELDIAITVDRTRQLDAIRQHHSQSTDNPVVWRRLDLHGATEHLRYLN